MSLYESPRKTSSKTAVHLWEFLLDLLLDEKSGNVIGWTNREAGEFKLKNQEEVARRWGNLKHRPGMNYDKLSRALRYYYQKGIIKKVNGQRLVYKFVNPPLVKSGFPQEITTKASQASQTVEATEKEPELKDKNEAVEMPCPCVRTNAISLPQATLTSSSLGFRIIQAPLVSQGHMTYPMSMYPYIVPCVIPACRSVGVIKS